MPAGRRQPLIEVMRAIGVPVPRHLSSLPYSFFS